LVKQWASLFQRLLQENITKTQEDFRRDILLEKIENLETAVISTIKDQKTKIIARSAMQFRRLIEFLFGLSLGEADLRSAIYTSEDSFPDLLKRFGITSVEELPESRRVGGIALIKDDNTYFIARTSMTAITASFPQKWSSFLDLTVDERKIVMEAILDQEDMLPPLVRYFTSDFFVDHRPSPTDLDDEIPF